MLAFVRKNLASLVTKHRSVPKSYFPHSLSFHFFSTRRREKQLDTNHEVYGVLVHKHNFSPEVASLVASHLPLLKSPEKADLVLSFLEDCYFSTIQLEKIFKYKPEILSYSVENVKFKIKILQDLGLSPEDVAKTVSSTQVILHLSAKNNIIPKLSSLKGLLGSDHEVARLVRISGRVLLSDLEKTLFPNVELLKSFGIPMERILVFLYTYPRCLLLKPDTIRKSLEKAKELGLSESSKIFIYAVRIIASYGTGKWEVKLQSFRDLGFSDSDTVSMFKKIPLLFNLSMKKIAEIKELLLATGKIKLSNIISSPACLGCSIEKRLKPRLRILGILESKNLIKEWPALGTLCTLTNDKFFQRFDRLCLDEDGSLKGEDIQR